MIRVTTYTSHPGAASGAEAEVTFVKVEILDSPDEKVLASGRCNEDREHKSPIVEAAGLALAQLKAKVIQAEKELRAMGLLPPRVKEDKSEAGEVLSALVKLPSATRHKIWRNNFCHCGCVCQKE